MSWYQKLKRERILRGWSQADVGQKIGCDSKTVGRWERGISFPGPYYQQKLMELFEKSTEELGLLKQNTGEVATRGIVQSSSGQEDWGEASHIENFYGRVGELTEAEQWITVHRCRMIAVLGIGGVGKTTFATMVARRVKHDFDYVFWRSLQNTPPLENILASYFQGISGQQQITLPQDPDEQISLFITFLRKYRCLLLLDNVESVLQASHSTGQYLHEYEGYGKLLHRVGDAYHQSCLILTSREKPREVILMEGEASSVRSISLPGLGKADGQKLLQDKHLFGTDETWAALIHLYSGNPLTLKLVSEPIREIFGGNIASFLNEGEAVFGDIYDFLYQQWHRLTELEQWIMYWLTIERTMVSLADIWKNMIPSRSKAALLEALSSLRRRSMVERDDNDRFALQPVILEYVTTRIVRLFSKEIEEEKIALFGSHALLKAQAYDYVRQSQIRFILLPVVERLFNSFGKAGCEKRLKGILSELRLIHPQKFPYAAGNVLNLLIQLKSDLRGYDFSQLRVRQAYLQGVALPEVNFAHAYLATSLWTDTFSSPLCVTVSPDGKLLAVGTTTDEVRMWRADDLTPLFTFLGHTDEIRSIAFSPESKILASGGDDQTIRLWDTRTGLCLNILRGHKSVIRSIAFSPSGKILASGSEDQTIRLWDTRTNLCLSILQGHKHWIRAIAFSPSGKILASGSEDQTIQLWNTRTNLCLKTLHGHTGPIRTIAFSPSGKILTSGSEDHTIRLWDVRTGLCLSILQGHTDRVRTLAFALDSQLLASGSDDQMIRFWDIKTSQCLKILQGHTNRVWSLAFVSGKTSLFSVSEDDTLRLWDVHTGQCLKTLQGYTALIKSIAFHPDGQILASGSEDQAVRLWDTETGLCLSVLLGHANRIRSVAFNPHGTIVASCSEDETIRLWNTHTGLCLRVLRGHTHLVRSVAFSPNGNILASCSHDTTVRLWNLHTGHCLKTLEGHKGLVWSVAFSPDRQFLASSGEDQTILLWNIETGKSDKILRGHTHRIWSLAFNSAGSILASCSDDQTVRLWDTSTGNCLKVLQGHTSWVRSVAFSSNGNLVASGSQDQTVRIWDVSTGQCIKTLYGHTSCIWSVTFNPVTNIVASGGDDGTIKFWDTSTGECTKTLRSQRPYEGMNITKVEGLSEAQKTSLKILGAVEDDSSV